MGTQFFVPTQTLSGQRWGHQLMYLTCVCEEPMSTWRKSAQELTPRTLFLNWSYHSSYSATPTHSTDKHFFPHMRRSECQRRCRSSSHVTVSDMLHALLSSSRLEKNSQCLSPGSLKQLVPPGCLRTSLGRASSKPRAKSPRSHFEPQL